MSTKVMHRAAYLRGKPQGRTVTYVASTEAPVDTGFGREVLRMSGCDLRAYRRNPVVLDAHRRESISDVIGTSWARIEGLELVADVTYLEDEDGERALSKVLAGALRAVSIGYAVDESSVTRVRAGETVGGVTGPAVIVGRWSLLEISNVPIPADANALRREVYRRAVRAGRSRRPATKPATPKAAPLRKPRPEKRARRDREQALCATPERATRARALGLEPAVAELAAEAAAEALGLRDDAVVGPPRRGYVSQAGPGAYLRAGTRGALIAVGPQLERELAAATAALTGRGLRPDTGALRAWADQHAARQLVSPREVRCACASQDAPALARLAAVRLRSGRAESGWHCSRCLTLLAPAQGRERPLLELPCASDRRSIALGSTPAAREAIAAEWRSRSRPRPAQVSHADLAGLFGG